MVATVALAAALSSTGCVLGRPHTATVLAVDALGMVAGGLLMASYDEGSGRGEDSGPPSAGYYGEPLLKVSAVCALATLVLYVIDRESEIAAEKRQQKDKEEKDKEEKAKKALRPSEAPLSLQMRPSPR